jgi:hypothetical protein
MRPVRVVAPSRLGDRVIDCWPTGVPGLVVGQVPPGFHHGGRWRVFHARSGGSLSYCLPDPEAALGLARAVAGVTDWQQPAEAVSAVVESGACLGPAAAYESARCLDHVPHRAGCNDNGVIA